MEVMEWTLPEHGTKRSLPPGPWDNEPDKMQWPDPETGLACMVRRGPLGAWCGYVGVDETHPWFGKSYMDVGDNLDVHGGLTYSALCDGDPAEGICHVPAEGEPDPLYWFGFDCAHFRDHAPAMPEEVADGVYRDLAYVRSETTALAGQLAAVVP